MHIPRHPPGLSFSERFFRRHTSSSYSSYNNGNNDDMWSTTANASGSRSRFSRRQSSDPSSSSTSSSSDDSSDGIWSTAATTGRGSSHTNKKRKPSTPSTEILDYCPVCDSYEPCKGHDPRKAKSGRAISRRNSLPNTANDGRRKVRFQEETVRRDYVEQEDQVNLPGWPRSIYYLGDPWTIPLFSRGRRLAVRVKERRLYRNPHDHCECCERVTVNVTGGQGKRLRRVRSFWGMGW
ncbi:hypothetical protein FPQ18DRAFT_350243 [Pyronema domesticum]|uniref:Uncharacterized protein n=1 Tax=Pyronema omphalodes (strain CBS 100304) TaxID=1076935 RepID=U4L8A3_PYROM|nr:hypothetical protein FPQ18DRAFT_350243 [Pyronema domesticum]CCX09537.1 Protein of unknown function [Pyronema omphalodes CBS 100304]